MLHVVFVCVKLKENTVCSDWLTQSRCGGIFSHGPWRQHASCGVSGKRLWSALPLPRTSTRRLQQHTGSIPARRSARFCGALTTWHHHCTRLRHVGHARTLSPQNDPGPRRALWTVRAPAQRSTPHPAEGAWLPASPPAAAAPATRCQVARKKVCPGAAAPTVTWRWPLPTTRPRREDLQRRCSSIPVSGRWVSRVSAASFSALPGSFSPRPAAGAVRSGWSRLRRWRTGDLSLICTNPGLTALLMEAELCREDV